MHLCPINIPLQPIKATYIPRGRGEDLALTYTFLFKEKYAVE